MGTHNKIKPAEREKILVLLAQNKSSREIAKEIGRHHSSISREIQRNGMNRDNYSVTIAQVDRNICASKAGRKSKMADKKVFATVKKLLLHNKWSPEQISNSIRLSNSNITISPEAIYRFIYNIDETATRLSWIGALRQHRRKRRPKYQFNQGKKQKFKGTSIHNRPKEVNDREEMGHWEGDLIMGKGNKSALGTLVERKSRLTLLVELKGGKTSEEVVKAFQKKFEDNVPIELRKSLTYDNGSEMAMHVILKNTINLDVYFADPGCPGQRGSNENTNGLIRQFFPKKTDFNNVSEEEIRNAERLLNRRPRKILDFKTPQELFKKAKKKYQTSNPER
jgi:transposase, IS30 family